MAEEERARVDSELYVNPATLELLRRRIESEVKSGFFRSVGLPVGGAGVLAILFALFVWIPDKIATFIEKDPNVQEKLKSSAVAYLNDPEKGQKFVRTQVEAFLPAYLQDPKGGQEIIRQHIEKTGQKHVETATASFFKESGPKLIRELVDKHLKSPEVKELLVRSINDALQPKVTALSEEIHLNIGKLVVKIKEPFGDVKKFSKGSSQKLDNFLRSNEARELKSKGTPIALTITIRGGQQRYDENVIKDYLHKLRSKFGRQFRHVLFLDNDGKFLALLSPEQLQIGFTEDAQRLMDLLNSTTALSTSEATRELERLFSKRSATFIRSEWNVRKALSTPVWSSPQKLNKEVAVVGSRKKFIGTTSRRRLIEGILS